MSHTIPTELTAIRVGDWLKIHDTLTNRAAVCEVKWIGLIGYQRPSLFAVMRVLDGSGTRTWSVALLLEGSVELVDPRQRVKCSHCGGTGWEGMGG